ncbi:MAG TPA: hypothetical protein VNN10_00895 [Dehalococcoidia bacterium]|nr:hypothetical protein [Dehalococcoidia bacterium]
MATDLITHADLRDLLRSRGPHRVSIYLPTRKAGPATRENPIRLKNLLRLAEEQLVASGMRPTSAKDLLRPGYEIEEVQEFRADLGNGLALFFDDHGMRRYRLPVETPELAVVSDRFDVKPLLSLLLEDAAYYLLALSMNETRAFRGHRFDIHELAIEGMPRSIEEALWPDDLEKQTQFRTAITAVSGRGDAVFYSSGDPAADRLKEDIARYFKMVDDAVVKAIQDGRAPLVLASVEYLQSIYRNVSSHKRILEDGIKGNPDRMSPERLAEEAWPLVREYYEAEREAEAERFGNLTGTGRTSTSVAEIVEAAAKGRVETLWVASGEERWGRLLPGGRAEEHDVQQPGDDDLLDIAAVETLANGGTAYVVERERVPGRGQVAAIFRY